jgi:tetratricopeptide (TPR) repeat protein
VTFAILLTVLFAADVPVERLIDQGRLAEARAVLAQSPPADARRAALLEAMILYRESKPGEALAKLRPQLDAGDASADSYKLAALCLVATGEKREAGRYIRQAVARKADDAMAQYYLGLFLMDGRDFDGAAASLREAIRLNPAYPDSYTMLGLALEESGQEEAALEQYREGVARVERLGLPRPSAYIYPARFFQARGRNAEAFPLLDLALKADPRSAEAWLLKGKAHAELSEIPAAITALEKAAALAPNDKRPHFQLMRVYQRAGRNEDARRERDVYQRMTGAELGRWEESVLKPGGTP